MTNRVKPDVRSTKVFLVDQIKKALGSEENMIGSVKLGRYL